MVSVNMIITGYDAAAQPGFRIARKTGGIAALNRHDGSHTYGRMAVHDAGRPGGTTNTLEDA